METNGLLEYYDRCVLLKFSNQDIFSDSVQNDSDSSSFHSVRSSQNTSSDLQKTPISCDSFDLSSVYRSRRCVQQIIKLNTWDYFVTLTFKSNDLSSEDLLVKSLNRVKYLLKKGNLQAYCFVPELQPKSGKLHYHGFIRCSDKSMLDSGCVKVYGVEKPVKISTYNRKYKGRLFEPVYNWADWNLGFSACYKVSDDMDKLLVYMIKYILKYMDSPIFQKQKAHRYFAGGDIKREPERLNFQYYGQFSDFELKKYSIPKTNINVAYLQLTYDEFEKFCDENSIFLRKESI